MNERIKELMAEADRKCSETRGIYDEILAELIVHECANVADGYVQDGHIDIARLIKRNFGVAE